MIESFLSEENKNKIKNVIYDVVWPIKIYSIIIILILLMNVYYLYKIFILIQKKQLI
jgi:hypothetical protein